MNVGPQKAKIAKNNAVSDWVACEGHAGTVFVPKGWPNADIGFLLSPNCPPLGESGAFDPLYDDLGALVKIQGIAEHGAAVAIPKQALTTGFLRFVAIDPKTEDPLPMDEERILVAVFSL